MRNEDAGAEIGVHVEHLLDMLPGGFPQPHSKLRRGTWHRAAQLFAASDGQIKLRELCDACSVSHRTAWRIREALRDSAQALKERRRSVQSPTSNPLRRYRGEVR